MSSLCRWFAVPLVGTLCVGLVLSVPAEQSAGGEKKGDKKKANAATGAMARSATVTESAKGVSDLHLAYGLVHFGRKHKAPEALIAAARIFIAVPSKEIEEKADREKHPKAAATGEEKKMGKGKDNSPKALLAEAKKMSGNNEHVVALADSVAKLIEEPRGSIGGTFRKLDTLPVGMTDIYKRTFRANELAEVAVAVDPGTDIDLIVLDDAKNVISRVQGPRLDFLARWVPIRTDLFYILVVYQGKTPARYAIVHN